MGTEDLQGAASETVVTETSVIDAILEAHGQVQPPAGSFTVNDYVRRAMQRGTPVKQSYALRVLREMMELGQLNGRKMYLNGRQRWVFWKEG